MDLGIIIALDEEFQVFHELFGPGFHVETDIATGGYYYKWTYPDGGADAYRLVVSFAGQMGTDASGRLTQRLIQRYSPRTIVNLGIAGGIQDVFLGDLVIAEQVDSYLERSKAVQQGEDRFELVPGGQVYRTTATLLHPLRNLRFAHHEAYSGWTRSCRINLEQNVDPNAIRELSTSGWLESEAKIAVGHLASGPTVGAATAFATWLKQRDRNIICLEMEAAGITAAVSEQSNPINTLILRGISDLADENKGTLDSKYKSGIRRCAMQNATQMLKLLMDNHLLPQMDSNPGGEGNGTSLVPSEQKGMALTTQTPIGTLMLNTGKHGPLRFSWSDLKELISSLHQVFKSELATSISKYDFLDTDLETKNRINNLGLGYFREMKSNHEPYFERIREFLTNPINRTTTDLYYDIVSELRMKIAAMASDEDRFEHVLIWFAEEAMAADSVRLRGQRGIAGSLELYVFQLRHRTKGMIKPTKYMDLDTSMLNVTAVVIGELRKNKAISLDELYEIVLHKLGDLAAYNFGPALSFLYLAGKIEYNDSADAIILGSSQRAITV